MKKELTNLYDHITMPPECVQRIEKALAQEQPEPNWVVQKQAAQSQSGWWFLPAAVCLVLAVMILFPSLAAPVTLSPSATQPIALELPDFLVQNDDVLFFTCGEKKPIITGEYVIVPSGSDALRINNLLSMDDPLVYLDQQADGTWNYYAMGGHYENKVLNPSTFGWAAWKDVIWDENGKLVSFASLESANTQTQTGQKQPWFRNAEEKLAIGWGLEKTSIPEKGQLPAWLKEENGQLYFTFNGAKTDITNVISNDTPFLFCYYGVLRETRYFAVGGSYDPEAGALESIGWAEWNHSHQVRPGNEGGYVGCHFHNTENASGQRHSWYSRAIEEMNLFNGPGLDTLIPQDVQIDTQDSSQ